MLQPPWTEIGRLQSDISQIESRLNQKVDKHELAAVRDDLAYLERAFREISASLHEVRGWCHELQEGKGGVP